MSDDTAKDNDQSRAREGAPTTREERVLACMALMPHRWERGKTPKVLAAQWDCSVAVVEQASAEAWRRLNAQDVTWVRQHLCAELEEAMRDAKTIAEIKDRVASVVKVADSWAPLVGARAATNQKVEVSGTLNHQLEALPAPMRVELEAIEAGDAGARLRFALLDVAEAVKVALGSGATPEEVAAQVARGCGVPMLGEGGENGEG